MATYKPYKKTESGKEEIKIPYSVLSNPPNLSVYAKLAGGNTFSDLQTINAPTNVNGSEQTTMKVKTSNGGAIIFGKEGANSGTMIRLDQTDGTCRLRFRSSKTAGAMVWEQPEQGAKLHVDLGKDGSDKHRVTFPSSAGTLALTSQVNAKYTKPSGGIPKTDLASDVQTSLGKADSALQAKDISGKANLSGGNTFTGTQTLNSPGSDGYSINASGYVKGSWLQAPSTGKAGSNTGKVCVLDGSGWVYYRTPEEVLSDAGGAKASDVPTFTLSGTTLTITTN